jgi:hypothetical protein
MLQPGGGLRFAPEPFACLWIGDVCRVQDLDRNLIAD